MRNWTKADIEFLKANYAIMDNKAIGAKLGFSGIAVRVKANRLGLKKTGPEFPWMTNQQRYRLKAKASGCCPHCGKPCAPYLTCEERRESERLRNTGGKPRKWSLDPKPAASTSTGFLTRVGHVMAHRMVG